MKRLLSLILCLVMCMSTVAFAAEEEEPGTSPQTFNYNVKYMASNRSQVWSQIMTEISAAEYPATPRAFDADMSFTIEGNTLNIKVVKATWEVSNLPTVWADDPVNASQSSLRKWMVQTLTYTQTNSEYDAALGSDTGTDLDIPSFNWSATGGVYDVVCTIGSYYPVTVRVNVMSVDPTVPKVEIEEKGAVYCTPDIVEYSTDRSSWRTIKNGAYLPSNVFGERLYFRTPASGNIAASDYITIYCKSAQEAPSKKPTLESNSYSVTITNASELKGCEFSINNEYYSSKTTWTGLSPSTKYNVYVRYPSNSSEFASEPISASISTTEGPKSGVTYDKVSTSSTVYMQAQGTVTFDISSKTMKASYTETDLSKLKNDITNTARKTSVVSTFDVSITPEENDTREYNKITYTMPKGLGLLQLRLHTPWFTVSRDTETTSIQLEEGIISSTSALKTWASGKSHVFRVYVNNKTKDVGEITVTFPWEWADRADLDGLKVGYTIDGKTSTILRYSLVEGGVRFTLPDNGYFYIQNLNRDYGKLPFMDSQSHWAYSYIQHAFETGLVAGVSATEFNPDGVVNRAQLITLLARLYEVTYEDTQLPYTDVNEDAWYFKDLATVYKLGVLKNVDNKFGPDETVSRADVAALVNKMFPYKGTIWTPFHCSDRDNIPTYALNAVDSLYTKGIMMGTSATNFSPEGTLTRAEIVTILYRMQTADYWQKSVTPEVTEVSNEWFYDQSGWLGDGDKTIAAMKAFKTSKGVTPYAIIRTDALGYGESASDYAKAQYEDKFGDKSTNGVVFVWCERTDGVEGFTTAAYSKSTKLTDSDLAAMQKAFESAYKSTTLTADEKLAAAFK